MPIHQSAFATGIIIEYKAIKLKIKLIEKWINYLTSLRNSSEEKRNKIVK
jgi:hypothetical protein